MIWFDIVFKNASGTTKNIYDGLQTNVLVHQKGLGTVCAGIVPKICGGLHSGQKASVRTEPIQKIRKKHKIIAGGCVVHAWSTRGNPKLCRGNPKLCRGNPKLCRGPGNPKKPSNSKKNHSDKKADVPNRQIKLFGRFVQCRTILVR